MNIPTATYRIQFNPDFGFNDAAGIVGYLADLGITHVYASPIFKARRDSSHGYDGVDPNRLNPQLGTPADFENLTRALQGHDMGLLLDIVPNHMAFDADNRMLADVLENGYHSKYYRFFDIDWNQSDPILKGRLLAPFLGKSYAACLVNGEISLRWDEDGFAAVYYDLKLPVRIDSYLDILGYGMQVQDAGAPPDKNRPDDLGLGEMLSKLASPDVRPDAAVRTEQVRLVKETLRNVYRGGGPLKQFIDARLHLINGEPGNAVSFVLLDRILTRQIFRLCYWKVACDEINYRRFFTINGLISLRQEKEAVFDHTHALLTDLMGNGMVSGIRIDHIDGLADPTGYLNRLRLRFKDGYILVEKILDPAERLPDDWPVQGTTGYEFANILNGLFVRPENENSFTKIYNRFCGGTVSFENAVHDGKRGILETQLAGDLDNLVGDVKRFSNRTWSGRDFTFKRLRAALSEMLVQFPVYRTYIDRHGPREADRQYLATALSWSIAQRPRLEAELLFLQRLLLGQIDDDAIGKHADTRELGRQIRARFQQLTAPLMAKGFEDTALYVYNRFISLNDVGGDPRRFGCSPADFHTFVAKRALRRPHAMNSTATHDSKRGEDVRARLNVLSEIPAEWGANLERWHAANQDKKDLLNGLEVPDNNEEYFLYQTLVGAFPVGAVDPSDFIDRISSYMVKAAREAKINTSWLDPNEAHEAALTAFVKKILHPAAAEGFWETLSAFAKKVARYGVYNSLSQNLIKITAPGVPDFYQGTELQDLTLVDPDNRRSVDYAERAQLLKAVQSQRSTGKRFSLDGLPAGGDGRLKLYLTAEALKARNMHLRLYRDGGYLALKPAGRFHNHVVAFVRHWNAEWSITAVPRFLTDLVDEKEAPLGAGVWQDTVIELPDGAPSRWKNIFTGEELTAKGSLALGDILAAFPAALLIGE